MGWRSLHASLAEQFAVYAPTHPGFGSSERPAWARSVRDLAILHLGLLEQLGLDHVIIVGLGFGGWVAAEMASMCRHGLDGLLLVGAMGLKPAQGEILDQFLVSTSNYVRAGFATEAGFAAVYGAAPDVDQLETWELSREMASRVAWQPYMYNPALPHLLAGVSAPTLVVWGSEDRVVPLACGQQYVQCLPNARLLELPGAGHYVDLEQPDVLAAHVAGLVGQTPAHGRS
jgi:pimeloyl-ACP methyl ester carboxylesterase